MAPENAGPQVTATPASQAPTDLSPPREKLLVRKRRTDYFMVKLAAAWVLCLLLIILVAKRYWGGRQQNPKPFVSQAEVKKVVSTEDIILLEKSVPQCSLSFSNFLASGTPEARSQYVINPIDTTARMSRFNSMNPLFSIDPKTITLRANEVVHLPTGRAIETLWSTADDRVLDVVFMEEKGMAAGLGTFHPLQ